MKNSDIAIVSIVVGGVLLAVFFGSGKEERGQSP